MNSLIMLKIVDWLHQEKRFCCCNFILLVQNDIDLLQIFKMFFFILEVQNDIDLLQIFEMFCFFVTFEFNLKSFVSYSSRISALFLLSGLIM